MEEDIKDHGIFNRVLCSSNNNNNNKEHLKVKVFQDNLGFIIP